MLTRVLIATDDEPTSDRLDGFLRHGAVASVSARGLDDLWEKLTREDFDLLMVDRSLLPSSPREFLGSLQALPEHPGVIVLAREDQANQRAELLRFRRSGSSVAGARRRGPR